MKISFVKKLKEAFVRHPYRRSIIFFLCLLMVGALIAGLVRRQEIFLSMQAFRIYASCRYSNEKISCYENLITKTTDSFSMEDSFRIVRFIQRRDPGYQDCHNLGHRLGGREVSKDPELWKEVIARCPSDMCTTGCMHGAFRERFRKTVLSPEEREIIKPELARICSAEDGVVSSMSYFEQVMCYHGIGHLVIFLSQADIRESVAICRDVTSGAGKDFAPPCFDGIFMQIFQPADAEEIFLVKNVVPPDDGVPEFCAAFPGFEKSSCFLESPLRDAVTTPEELVSFCALQSSESGLRRCYGGMVRLIASKKNFDIDGIERFCTGLPETWQSKCFSDAASRMMEADTDFISKAGNVCARAEKRGFGINCYKQVIESARLIYRERSPALSHACKMLPLSWRKQCNGW